MKRRRSHSNRKSKSERSHTTYLYEKGFDHECKQYEIPYELGTELGKGGFAQCYSIKVAGENHLFAVKIFNKKSERSRNLEKINNEIEIMSSLKHEGIVRFYRRFQSEDHIYMIMERCSQGVLYCLLKSLSDVMKNRGFLTEPQVRYLVGQLVPILCYLRESNVIHRDIKMGNIFFDDKFKVKLGDFGLSTYSCNHLLKKNICGTPNYIAPEVISRDSYGCEVDVWSTGILIHTLLLGKPPFEAKSVSQTYDIILKCELNFKPICEEITISSYAMSFLNRMIEKDRSKRIKLQEMLQHPFMTLFEVPNQLQLTFPIRQPSKLFMKRYNTLKNKQSCSSHSSKESSGDKLSLKAITKLIDPIEISGNQKKYLLSADKIEELRNLSDQSIEKTQQMQHALKRDFSEEQIQQYFTNVTKRFKTNANAMIETRTNRRKKLQIQQLVLNLKQICRKQSLIPMNRIRQILKLGEESSQSKKSYNFYSFVRVIYLQNTRELSYSVYLTNYYLMGIIFTDKSSIIHHLYYKKTFYLQNHNIAEQTIELSADIVAEEYKGEFKSKLESFSLEQKKIKQLLRNDSYIKNATAASLDQYQAFCFVTQISTGKHCKVISFSNGDITFFKSQVEAFALSTQKHIIELYCQGSQKFKLHIDRICQMPDLYRGKLRRYCRYLQEISNKDVSVKNRDRFKEREERHSKEKGEQFCQGMTSGGNIYSK